MGEDGSDEGSDWNDSFLFFLGGVALDSFCRMFKLVLGTSRRAFLRPRAGWGPLRRRGVKKRLKRRGVTGGGFFILELRRGLEFGSVAIVKDAASLWEGLPGDASI